MSLFGMPEGVPCCCLSGCCEGIILPDCITLELESSCCPGDIATVILTKEGASETCPSGEVRPFTAADSFCEETPDVIYTGALDTGWCTGAELGDGTVNVFCCIDSVTHEQTFWIYISDNDLSHTWYPASTAQFYQLTLVSCDPLLLQFGDTPDCGEDTCIWTWTAVCFIEGTLIRTPTGEVTIESLKVGDLILDIYGRVETVLATIPTEVDVLLRITAENGLLTGVTPEHPFMDLDMESTIEAGKLKVGQPLPFGKSIIESQLFKTTKEKFNVHNLKVSGSNTFIADGFAVHNKGQS